MHMSDAAFRIQGQPMFKVLAEVQKLEQAGENIIHFEIGDPDFDTPRHIIDAAYESMMNGETHYENSMGLLDFRKAAAVATLRSRHFLPDINQILVTPGANFIIYAAIFCLVDKGADVLIPDPGFPTYYSVANLCQVNPVRIPLREENNFHINPSEVRRRITPNTKLIIINSPSNPTGAVLTKAELDEIYEIAVENRVYLLCDEVYSRMMYEDSNKFYSPSENDQCRHTTLVMNGFSKAFAMTGWRLGVVIAPAPITEKLGLLVQTICSSVPTFIQRAGIAAINGQQRPIIDMMTTYKERRDCLVDGLNKIDGIHCVKPEGAFYAFPNITGTGMTSDEFSEFALKEAKIAVLPGNNFGFFGEGCVRFAYAISMENIKEGLKRLTEALSKRG
jgi:aspartate aminotransferase